MYIRDIEGIPKAYTLGDLRKDNPDVSFPRGSIADEVLASFGVYSVRETPAPLCDGKTHRTANKVEMVDGVWTRAWDIIRLPLGTAESNIRAYRDRLLNESDWVVTKSYEQGEAVAQKWINYRQALRDIPNQEGFPYNIVWPNLEE